MSRWKFGGYYEVTGMKAGGWPLVPIDSAPTDVTPLHRHYLRAIKNNNMIKAMEIKITNYSYSAYTAQDTKII